MISSPRSVKYILGVDGSAASRFAFETTARFLKVPQDHLTIVHIADDSKTYLLHELKPAAIEEYFNTRCLTRFPKSTYNFNIVKKGEKQGTREALSTFVNEPSHVPDIFVVGFHGRKGPKEDPSVAGSTADSSLRSINCSSLIVKNKPLAAGEPATLLVGVDGSDGAHNAVELLDRMRRPEDTLLVVHIQDPSDRGVSGDKKFTTEAVTARYTAYAAGKSNAVFQVLHKSTDGNAASELVALAESKDAHMLAVGVDGLGSYTSGREKLGSVTDAVVKNARCDVLTVKSGSRYFMERGRSLGMEHELGAAAAGGAGASGGAGSH